MGLAAAGAATPTAMTAVMAAAIRFRRTIVTSLPRSSFAHTDEQEQRMGDTRLASRPHPLRQEGRLVASARKAHGGEPWHAGRLTTETDDGGKQHEREQNESEPDEYPDYDRDP